MDMHKGYTYYISKYCWLQENLQKYNLASQNKIYINKIQNKINYGWD